jgi:hypothetical protein
MKQDEVLNLSDVQVVIDSIEDVRFDSHDFIREYISKFASSYGLLLIKHGNVNTAHGEIANFLKANASELHIIQLQQPSFTPNIFNNTTECESWQKV